MKLSTLITVNWGTLENREWEISDALLLTGESGSGKSTLLDAMQTLLTAARAGLFHFNVGQDESTQTRKGGKEPRTLAAYALGQVADAVFVRRRARTYIAAVFEASESAGESEPPFTALIGVEATLDQNKAILDRTRFLLVRRVLSLSDLRAGQGTDLQTVSLKDVYLHLQSRLQVGAEVVQSFDENKGRYLQHLYGAFMGKAYVPEADAFRAARSIVKAMAYKELGNVHDLVRDEILDANDFSAGVTRLRELMQTMARLKGDAERLRVNISRLKSIEERSAGALDVIRRFVVMTVAYAIRERKEAEDSLNDLRDSMSVLEEKNSAATARKVSLQEEMTRLGEHIAILDAKLRDDEVARERDALRSKREIAESSFRQGWGALRSAAASVDAIVTRTAQFCALDLSSVPALAQAAASLSSAYAQLSAHWRSGLDKCLLAEAQIRQSLPVMDASQLDEDVSALIKVLRTDEASVTSLIVQALVDTQKKIGSLADEDAQLAAELNLLRSGKSPAPSDTRFALRLIEQELPQASPKLLAQLVEPKPGTEWINAIEGYMARDRFAIIVTPECESQATRLVRQRCPARSAKIVQGTKALEDTRQYTVPPNAVIHELRCAHPTATAYLRAQYGRVRKVKDEEELRRTSQGLTVDGMGSRGYGMFACWAEDADLAFGEESRRRRAAWCEQRIGEIGPQMQHQRHLAKSLKQIATWFSDLAQIRIEPLINTLADDQRAFADNEHALALLDTSSIDSIETERDALKADRVRVTADYEDEIGRLAVQLKQLREFTEKQSAIEQKLPGLKADETNAAAWITRFGTVARGLATETQLRDEAEGIAFRDSISLGTIDGRIDATKGQLASKLQEVRDGVDIYLSGVRTADERFLFRDPPRDMERMEEVLQILLGLGSNVADQLRRQESIGLAQNLETLKDAEAQFNAVFTTGFCFKVRDDVRSGLNTLNKLNRQMKSIRFGYDTYELDWDWVPQFKRYFDFFEAVDGITDSLETEKVSIFDSPRLTPEEHATAGNIRDLLLSDDHVQSERLLRELADYRNYRRYDIIRRNESGSTRLSTWGTGSGGELETPFYVIRASVLAHALGHFGRDKQGAPALRLMLSDEAFAKMDESRSRSVLRFLSDSLHLQLIVAMPTSKSGAVKPEFAKEFTFSKVSAKRDGAILHLSEVQEKWLKQSQLRGLWARHAEAAREEGRAEFLRRSGNHGQDAGPE